MGIVLPLLALFIVCCALKGGSAAAEAAGLTEGAEAIGTREVTEAPGPAAAVSHKDDQAAFKSSYEALNGVTREDGVYLPPVRIREDNRIVCLSESEAWEMVENRETCVILFGASWCRWCRVAAPLVTDVAAANDMERLYYVEVKTQKAAGEPAAAELAEKAAEEEAAEQREAEQKLSGLLWEYAAKAGTSFANVTGTQEMVAYYKQQSAENAAGIFFPAILFLNEGTVTGMHIGTVSDQTDVTAPLTREQTDEFRRTFREHLEKLDKSPCPWKCEAGLQTDIPG